MKSKRVFPKPLIFLEKAVCKESGGDVVCLDTRDALTLTLSQRERGFWRYPLSLFSLHPL